MNYKYIFFFFILIKNIFKFQEEIGSGRSPYLINFNENNQNCDVIVYHSNNFTIVYNNSTKINYTLDFISWRLVNISSNKFIVMGYKENDDDHKLYYNIFNFSNFILFDEEKDYIDIMPSQLNFSLNSYNSSSILISYHNQTTYKYFIYDYIQKIILIEKNLFEYNETIAKPSSITCDNFKKSAVFCVYQNYSDIIYHIQTLDNTTNNYDNIYSSHSFKVDRFNNKFNNFIICYINPNLICSYIKINENYELSVYQNEKINEANLLRNYFSFKIYHNTIYILLTEKNGSNTLSFLKVYSYNFQIKLNSITKENKLYFDNALIIFEGEIHIYFENTDGDPRFKTYCDNCRIYAEEALKLYKGQDKNIYIKLNETSIQKPIVFNEFTISSFCSIYFYNIPLNFFFINQFNEIQMVKEKNDKENEDDLVEYKEYDISKTYYISYSINMLNEFYYYIKNNVNNIDKTYDSPLYKVTVILCYISCSTCYEGTLGDKNQHLCYECETSFYPILDSNFKNDVVYNCYSPSESIQGYYFDYDSSSFKTCNESCFFCNNSNSCINCTENYYFKSEEDNGLCYNISTEKYFLNKTSLKLDNCYETCLTCYDLGNSSFQKCLTCDEENYHMYNYELYNCKPKCPSYYYLNLTNDEIKCLNYNCSNDDLYFVQDIENICVKDCKNFINPNDYRSNSNLKRYTYLNNKTCLQSCDEYLMNINEYEYICSDKIIESSSSLSSSSLYISSNSIFSKSHSECDSCDSLSNSNFDSYDSSSSKNEICYEEIKTDFILTSINNINLDINFEKFNLNSTIIKLYNSTIYEGKKKYNDINLFTLYIGKDFTLSIYKYISEDLYNSYMDMFNLTKTNYSQLFTKLRKLLNNDKFLIFKFDILRENQTTNQTEYIFYNYNEEDYTINQINISNETECNVTNYYPIRNFDNLFYKIRFFIEEGIDLFNSEHPFFNDICFTYTNEKKRDVTILDRRKYYYLNKTLCENNCSLERIDYDKMISICNCKLKTSFSNTIEYNNDKNNIEEKSISNIHAIKCNKEVFNKNTLADNAIFWIFIFLSLFQVITIIWCLCIGNKFFEIYLDKNLNKEDEEIISKNNIKEINENINKQTENKYKNIDSNNSSLIINKLNFYNTTNKQTEKNNDVEIDNFKTNYANPPKKNFILSNTIDENKDINISISEYNNKNADESQTTYENENLNIIINNYISSENNDNKNNEDNKNKMINNYLKKKDENKKDDEQENEEKKEENDNKNTLNLNIINNSNLSNDNKNFNSYRNKFPTKHLSTLNSDENKDKISNFTDKNKKKFIHIGEDNSDYSPNSRKKNKSRNKKKKQFEILEESSSRMIREDIIKLNKKNNKNNPKLLIKNEEQNETKISNNKINDTKVITKIIKIKEKKNYSFIFKLFRYFKKREILLLTLSNEKEYYPPFTLWSLLFCCLSLIFTLHCLLFTNTYIHKRYINQGKNNFAYFLKYEIGKCFLVALIAIVIKIILIKLFIILLFRLNLKNITKDNKKKYTYRMGCKLAIFYIVIILLFIISIYINICYGGIFKNSEIALIEGFIFSYIFSFIMCLVVCLIINIIFKMEECCNFCIFKYIYKILKFIY